MALYNLYLDITYALVLRNGPGKDFTLLFFKHENRNFLVLNNFCLIQLGKQTVKIYSEINCA